MSAALFSIRPQFVQAILRGEKKFEFRTKICKRKLTTMFIYATKPIGMIVGEVNIETVISEDPEELWKLTRDGAGISKSEFDQYFRGREKAYAYKLKNPIFYNEAMILEDFGIKRAPQSYCYIEDRIQTKNVRLSNLNRTPSSKQ